MELENPNFLPEEILIEIFSRLPAKAVGRCRCLSKTWRTHLSTSQFAKLHLLNRTPNPQNLLLNNAVDRSLHIIDAPLIVDNTAVSRKLELGVAWNRVLGSCNGLVLLLNTKCELFLVNPITLQHFKLPPPLSLSSQVFKFNQYGLGYDGLSDDYKVVVLTIGYAEFAPRRFDRTINVYSVKSGAWNMVDDSRDCPGVVRNHDMSFVNGAIHCYSIRKNTDSGKLGCVIGSFDLAGDVFHEFPAAPLRVSYCDITLLVLEGCLCMSTRSNSDNIDIWMMKQYRLADSWTKFTITTNSHLCAYRLLCSRGDREIVFVSDDDTSVVYEFREGTTRVMILDFVPMAFRKGVAFLDSLVSPNHQYSN